MSGSDKSAYQFRLLEGLLTQIDQLLQGQQEVLEILVQPLASRSLVKTPEQYCRIAQCALGSLETIDLEKMPLVDSFSHIKKVRDSAAVTEDFRLVVGRRYEFSAMNHAVAGLYLLAGVSFFLAGNFEEVVGVLSKVSAHLDKGYDRARFLIGLSYLFLKEKEKALYFLNLASAGFAGDLLLRLASYYLKNDFSRIKIALESYPRDLAKFLGSDPLILYFYAAAIYQLKVFDRFNSILKAAFEHRFEESQKYYFLEDLLRELYQKFSEEVAGSSVRLRGAGCAVGKAEEFAEGAAEGNSRSDISVLGPRSGTGSSGVDSVSSSALCFAEKFLPPLKRVMSGNFVDGETGGSPFEFSDSENEDETPRLDGLSVCPDPPHELIASGS